MWVAESCQLGPLGPSARLAVPVLQAHWDLLAMRPSPEHDSGTVNRYSNMRENDFLLRVAKVVEMHVENGSLQSFVYLWQP